MKIKLPEDMAAAPELAGRLIRAVESELDPRLIVTHTGKEYVRVVFDSVNKLYVVIYDRGVARISCGPVRRNLWAFDFDSAAEWINSVAAFILDLMNHTVRLECTYTRSKRCIKQAIWRMNGHGAFDRLIVLPKTSNLFSLLSHRNRRETLTVTLCQQ